MRTMPRTTTVPKVEQIIEMFADATAGESYGQNRLITEETEEGNVALVGYGWITLAEYDESDESVTVYFGHKSLGSKTVSGWLNRIVETVSERREVTISVHSPQRRKPNDGARFIGEYISFEDKSPVERKAEETVVESLQYLNKFL